MAVFKCDVFATKVDNDVMFEVRSKSGGTRETFTNLAAVVEFLEERRVSGVEIEVDFNVPCGILWGVGAPRMYWKLVRADQGALYRLLDEAHRKG